MHLTFDWWESDAQDKGGTTPTLWYLRRQKLCLSSTLVESTHCAWDDGDGVWWWWMMWLIRILGIMITDNV